MTDKPIIFSGPMVRALLDGRKTQTRRVLKPQPRRGWTVWQDSDTKLWLESGYGEAGDDFLNVPYQPGDRLWVREACIIAPRGWTDSPVNPRGPFNQEVGYACCPDTREAARDYKLKVTPSIHMPRWASRLTLYVTANKVERLQEIAAGDAISEGIEPVDPRCSDVTIISRFNRLWDSINAKREGCSWEDNPWVVAVTFEARQGNIDSLPLELAA